MTEDNSAENPIFREDKQHGIDRTFMELCGHEESYVSGFGGGCMILMRQIATSEGHNLLFPACYLFRQYLELQCKLLPKAIWENHNSGEYKLKTGHKLRELWDAARIALESELPDRTPEDFDAVQVVIYAFADVDPDGDQFRYPTRIGGATSLEKLPSQVDRLHLHDAMDRAISRLDHWSYLIDNYGS